MLAVRSLFFIPDINEAASQHSWSKSLQQTSRKQHLLALCSQHPDKTFAWLERNRKWIKAWGGPEGGVECWPVGALSPAWERRRRGFGALCDNIKGYKLQKMDLTHVWEVLRQNEDIFWTEDCMNFFWTFRTQPYKETACPFWRLQNGQK